MKSLRIIAPFAVAIACTFSIGLTAIAKEITPQSNPSTSAPDWTPVEMRATISPSSCHGSDGLTSLVYEIILTNYKSAPVPLKSFQVFAEKAEGKPLLSLNSKQLSELLLSPAKSKDSTLAPGAVALLFVNVVLDKDATVPEKLINQLTYENSSKSGDTTKTTTDTLNVDKRSPIVIGPPLIGERWLASGGYAGRSGHRRSLFPIGNGMKCAQRFAIDWVQLDEKNRLFAGDKKAVESFFCYGKPVIAVADGTVYGVVDKFPNQPTFVPSGSSEYPGGNSITLKLNDNAYGFYAHLKPGSIRVKEGDRVKKGDVIALLGNAGNSDGPHLHFHITETPEILGSNGVPYVFEEFDITGETTEEEIDNNFSNGRSLNIGKAVQPGKHARQLPREGVLLNFPEAKSHPESK